MLALLRAELRRELRLWWSYRANALLEIGVYALVFGVLMVLFQDLAARSGAAYGPSQQAASVIGALVWHLCMGTMVELSAIVRNEADTGTLELVILSAPSALSMFMARAAAISLFRGSQTLLIGVLLVVILRLPLAFSLTMLPVLLLTLLGVWGMGLTFAGIALVYKQVQNLARLVGNLSLFFAGALVPLNTLGLVFELLKYFFPMTWGIDLLRLLLLGKAGAAMVAGQVGGLFVQTAILFGVGVVVFQWGLARARHGARLATY